MATDAQIKAESYWQREQVGPNLKAFGKRCCDRFDRPATEFGTAGNTRHLVGRHRSLEWNLYSKFASRRTYGTRDPRDTKGNHRLIRAFDLGLPAEVLHQVSRNVEDAVADGRAYMLAEWYGDLGDDGVVDGWYEGHDSTSDNSHKSHLHGGLWTIYADDEQALNDLFEIMTGDDMQLTDKIKYVQGPGASYSQPETTVGTMWGQTLYYLLDTRNKIAANESADKARDEAMLAAINALTTGGGSVDSAVVVNAVNAVGDRVLAKIDAEVTELRTENDLLNARLAAALTGQD